MFAVLSFKYRYLPALLFIVIMRWEAFSLQDKCKRTIEKTHTSSPSMALQATALANVIFCILLETLRLRFQLALGGVHCYRYFVRTQVHLAFVL